MNSVCIGDITSSFLGLGCGGFSRLGLGSRQKSENSAIGVVKAAYEQGIRFFDTAELYMTEQVLGEALKGFDRSRLLICSKVALEKEGQPKTADQIRRSLEKTLENLKTDYLDIYYAHGILPEQYDRTAGEIYPLLEQFKKEGLIRMAGISEMFGQDTEHVMMKKAVDEGKWDAVMVGYNLINQSGAGLLRRAAEKGLFRVNMFAVRQAMVNNEVFGIYMDNMIRSGKFRFSLCEFYEFKDELFRGADSVSFPGLAYRFVRDEGLFDIILTGTGNIEHLKDNIAAMEAPVLTDRIRTLLRDFYDGEKSLSGQEGFL